jgi:transcriptional regulator with XRE-family HTH domain
MTTTGERRNLAAAIGWLLRNQRARHNLSQARLAERLGVSQQYLSQVERGALAPTTDAIERIFGFFDLQVTLDVEPAGADLDGEIDEFAALTDAGRRAVMDCFERPLKQLAGVPWVLSGRLGAFVQGAPLRVVRLDLAVADADLDAVGAIFAREVCDRWNERLLDYYGAPLDPRAPGPMRWLLGCHEVRLEVSDEPPPSITVTVDDRSLPVRPLADIEAGHSDVARIMRRSRMRVIHRRQ